MCFTSTELTLRLALFFLFIFIPVVHQAQVLQPDRFEISIDNNDQGYEVIPAKENGLFLIRNLITNSSSVIELMKLDTSFTKKWQGYIEIEGRRDLVAKRSDKDNLYLLVRQGDLRKKDLFLYVVNQENGNYIEHKVRNIIQLMVTDFQVAKNGVIIGGYFNYIPVVLFFSFSTQTSRILPGLLNEQGELTHIKVNPDGSFDVLISGRTYNKQKTIWMKTYDENGNLQFQLPLIGEDNKSLLFARSVTTFNEMQLVAGTYGNKNSEYSRGIFVGSIASNGNQQIKYYNYADLENFFKYMKAKREQRIKERIERRKVRGKKVRFNYRFIVHEIVPYQDQYILLGEAFYPKYISTDPRFSNNFFSYTQPFFVQNGRIFDGFRYTHAVVMGFDKNGRLLWDNSFEINDVRTFTLEQFVRLELHEDKIALFYLHDNKIRSKIIRGNEVLEGKTSEPIRTTNEVDVAKNISLSSKFDYWYGRYFFASGTQRLVNHAVGERKVFYINKVMYQDLPNDN
jgi:hypothetical protein